VEAADKRYLWIKSDHGRERAEAIDDLVDYGKSACRVVVSRLQ